MFKKEELKLLWPFYLDALISPMLFFAPAFFIIYFLKLEFSLFQIGILLALPSFFSLIFEIPTGAVADLYGRKFSVMLGTLMQGVLFSLLFIFDNFYMIAVIFSCIGISATFISGARDAWTVDLIKKRNKKLLNTFFSKTYSLDSLGLFVSGFLGAFLVIKFGLSVIWIFTGLSFLISFFLFFFTEEEFTRKKSSSSLGKVINQSKKGISYTYKHKVLYYFMIGGMIFFLAAELGGALAWIPMLSELGIPEYAFGYLWSAQALLGIVAPIIASKFVNKNNEKITIVVLVFAWALISLIIFFAYSLALALVILLSTVFIEHAKMPLSRTYLHKFVPSKLRATIGSVEGMLISLAGIISAPLVGLAIGIIGPRNSILIGGIIALIAAFLYYKIEELKK